MIFYKLIISIVTFFAIPIIADECFVSNLVSPSPFMGNSGEIFRLENGMIGEVVAEYEYMYEYYPSVIICPSLHKIIVNNKKPLNIRMINTTKNSTSNKQDSSSIIETFIDGEFNGVEGNTIFKLMNGQIWQQSSYTYEYHYAYNPKVLIVKNGNLYKMQIDGMTSTINVIRLK